MSIRKNLMDGVVDCVLSDFIILKQPKHYISQLNVRDFVEIRHINLEERVAPIFYNDQGVLYQKISFDGGDILYWDFQRDNIDEVAYLDGAGVSSFYQDDKIQLLRDTSTGIVYERKLESFEFKKLYIAKFPSNRPLVWQGLIAHIGLGGELACFDFSGNPVWHASFNELCPHLADPDSRSGRAKIKQPAHLVGDKVIFHQYPGRFVCISIRDGSFQWELSGAVDFGWCVGNQDKIYSVRQGKLMAISSNDGSLISEKVIESDWVQKERIGLNLFQVEVTDTHLISGFIGHGLCAINLETGKIDWHDFDGMTCNRRPIIKNNHIYAQMTGGIELGQKGVQEFVLEGIGGYMECPDNRFAFSV